jgi:hypothetical protein
LTGLAAVFYGTSNYYTDTMNKPCYYCSSPSIATVYGLRMCDTHSKCSLCSGEAYGSYGKDNIILCKKHWKEGNYCSICSQQNCDCDYDIDSDDEPCETYQWRVEEFHLNMRDADVHLFDKLQQAVEFSVNKIVRITKVWIRS